MKQPHITLDFETRSEADLKKVGTARYAEDPSTEVKMMCWAYGDEDVNRWRGHPFFDVGVWPDPDPERLFQLIRAGVIVEAHNAFFERMIWRNIMVKRHGWPDIPDGQWRCSAAKAAACSLPRGLGAAVQAMQLPIEKDADGHKLMLRLCKPRAQWSKWKRGELVDKKTGLPKPEPQKYFQSAEEFERELEYCARDVEAERELSKSIPDLKPLEWQIWEVDQQMNARGIKCDIDMAKHMLGLIGKYRDHMRDELAALTNGEVVKETQRSKVLNWFLANDTTLPNEAGEFTAIDNTRGETLDEVAEFYQYDNYNRGRVAQIVRQLNKSSVSKFKAMIQRASEDDNRARDTLLFNGASTGRWCLTGDHEVLTPSGWVRLDEWSGGQIACWGEGDVSFARSEQNEFDAPNTLFRMDSTQVKQLSTGEHTMPFYDNKSKVFRTSEVKNLPHKIQVPFHGQIGFAERADPSETCMLIAVQGDGHYTEDGSIKFHMKKRRKIERLRKLCRRLDIPYSEQVYKSGTVTYIPSRGVPMFLKMFSDKTFGSWIWRLDPTVFFEELAFWDGHRGKVRKSFQYTTRNKTSAGLVQAFAHVNGMSARILVKNQGVRGCDTTYTVDVKGAPGPAHKYRHGVQEVPNTTYEKVFCPTTPTGFFLVRREGSVWVTGNSGKGVQLQNVPSGKIRDMEQAVDEALQLSSLNEILLSYDNPMEMFSGLIRGALVAGEGQELVVADFSSIEARGVMWLSQETEGLKIFSRGDCIYCDMASSVYGWQVEKAKAKAGDPKHSSARNGLGKKCLASDTVILTHSGPKRIIDVQTTDMLWDGEEWVAHGGLICAGKKQTIEVEGVRMTPDHKVMTHDGQLTPVSQALDANMVFPKLGTPLANSLSLTSPSALEEVLKGSRAGAVAEQPPNPTCQIYTTADPQRATLAQRKNQPGKDGSDTGQPCLMKNTDAGSSTACQPLSQGVTTPRAGIMSTTACAVSTSPKSGETTGQSFCGMFKLCPGGTTHPWRWTERTATGDTSRGTSGSPPGARICQTNDALRTSKPRTGRLENVYDILNAGPRNRFTVVCPDGSLWVVSNSILGLGYQMGPSKFLGTCEKGNLYFTDDMVDDIVPVDDQKIIESDIRENPIIYFPKGKVIEPRIRPLVLSKFVVERYRSKYTQVSQYWKDIEEAAMIAVQQHKDHTPNRGWVWVRGYRGPGEIAYKVIGRFLFCKLPSKRHLAYPYPDIKLKKTAWGTKKPTLTFMGVDSFTHRWCEQTTYGGKLTENVTQASSRDVMAEALLRIDQHPTYTPVLSVHDEAVTEATIGMGSAEELEEIMAETPTWAQGFPIEVEGWVGQRYRK